MEFANEVERRSVESHWEALDAGFPTVTLLRRTCGHPSALEVERTASTIFEQCQACAAGLVATTTPEAMHTATWPRIVRFRASFGADASRLRAEDATAIRTRYLSALLDESGGRLTANVHAVGADMAAITNPGWWVARDRATLKQVLFAVEEIARDGAA